MTIRRFDHRARFRAAYLNNTIDQLQQMNKVRFNLFGQGSHGTINMGGSATYGSTFSPADYFFQCPPQDWQDTNGTFWELFWLRYRNALPVWGTSYGETEWAKTHAEGVATEAANPNGGYFDALEYNGWGGYDLTGVTAETYLTGGGYAEAPTLSDYCPEEDQTEVKTDTGWKANDGAVVRVYPDDPTAFTGLDAPNHIKSSHNGATFSLTASGAGFYHLLQSLPPGSVVVKALLPVRLSGFTIFKTVETWDPQPIALAGGGVEWDSNYVREDTEVTSGEISFGLMGRRNDGTATVQGRVRRQSNWDMLGTAGNISVSTDEWTIADVTGLCNSYLNSWRNNHVHFSFLFFPTVGPAPGSSAAEWLAGLPHRPPFEIMPNPDWGMGEGTLAAFQHGYQNFANPSYDNQKKFQDYGPFNRERISEKMSWGSLEQGEGILQFKYPDLSGRYITVTNIVRGDNPILG